MKRSIFSGIASFFTLYGILFIPFPFQIFPFQQKLINAFFAKPVHSDSREMYQLVLVLFLAAIISAFIAQLSPNWKKIIPFIYLLGCYYLSLMLLKYGLDKIFLHQFYLPEPNTLFTPFGQMEKGLLYWTTMGTSPFYSVFMGILEVLAAVLLLFKRTRLFALLMSLAVLINIVAVNIGFDISVKLYSLFLLYLCIYLLWLRKSSLPVSGETSDKRRFSMVFLKWFAIGIILLEGLYPYIRSHNFNDSLAKRPFLHGVYEVKSVRSDKDSIPLVLSPVKRFFIHRNGYIIFQDRNDVMKDFKFEILDSSFILKDYKMQTILVPFQYYDKDSVLTIQYPDGQSSFQIRGKAIDWRKLRALKKGIHWISE